MNATGYLEEPRIVFIFLSSFLSDISVVQGMGVSGWRFSVGGGNKWVGVGAV